MISIPEYILDDSTSHIFETTFALVLIPADLHNVFLICSRLDSHIPASRN